MCTNNQLQYKGYTSIIKFDDDDKMFYGKIENINDLVVFNANNMTEAQKKFKDAVDDYLNVCKEPENPSKNFNKIKITLDFIF